MAYLIKAFGASELRALLTFVAIVGHSLRYGTHLIHKVFTTYRRNDC